MFFPIVPVLLLSLSLPVPPPEPALEPLKRFPPRCVAMAQRELATMVMNAIGVEPAWSEREGRDRRGWVHQAWKVWNAYDELCRAQDDTCDDDTRIAHLDNLRNWIGEIAFANGQMPSPVLLLPR